MKLLMVFLLLPLLLLLFSIWDMSQMANGPSWIYWTIFNFAFHLFLVYICIAIFVVVDGCCLWKNLISCCLAHWLDERWEGVRVGEREIESYSTAVCFFANTFLEKYHRLSIHCCCRYYCCYRWSCHLPSLLVLPRQLLSHCHQWVSFAFSSPLLWL